MFDGQLFISRITLQLLGVKVIPCRVASLINIQSKQKDWGQSAKDLDPSCLEGKYLCLITEEIWYSRETTFMTPCLFPWTVKPFQSWVYPQRKFVESFLARLFSKKTSRYCHTHSPVSGGGGGIVVEKL